MRQKWEYEARFCDYPLLNKELNKYGEDGWELVFCQLVEHSAEVTWYFVMKRPLE